MRSPIPVLSAFLWTPLICPAQGQIPPAGTRIHFAVLDREQRPVPSLDASDFELRVNGRAAPLEGFRAGRSHSDPSIPLVMWILLDFNPRINSDVVARQADAAAEFLGKLSPDSRVGVQLVSDTVEVLAPLARDREAVRSAFVGFRSHRMAVAVDKTRHGGLGLEGIGRAVELASEDIDRFISTDPVLTGRIVDRAVVVLSDGNINPSYNPHRLARAAAVTGVSVYPVFVPRGAYGDWLKYYFDLGRRSGGIGMTLGGLVPEDDAYGVQRGSLDSNALGLSLALILKHVRGKYSFLLPLERGKKARFSLKCRRPNVRIRMPIDAISY